MEGTKYSGGLHSLKKYGHHVSKIIIEVEKLDPIILRLKIKRVDLIKIDTEVTELDVSDICDEYEGNEPIEEQQDPIKKYLSWDYIDVCGPDLFANRVGEIINTGLPKDKLISIKEDDCQSINFIKCSKD